MIDLNKTSEALLYAVKTNKDTNSFREALSQVTINDLKASLNDDSKKKSFWINLYNAFFLILRKEDKINKPHIYKKKLIIIAAKKFSLDDFEHGILRRFRYKYSLGFFANIFTTPLIKQLAVEQLDYRIHFALNCGAQSCPPIAFYNHTKIDDQLDLATQSFLEGETEYDEAKQFVYTTALFKWFLGDFGGVKGIKEIYFNQLNKDITNYTIKYKDYSWEEDLNNFR